MAIARSLSNTSPLAVQSGHDIDVDAAVARYPSRTVRVTVARTGRVAESVGLGALPLDACWGHDGGVAALREERQSG